MHRLSLTRGWVNTTKKFLWAYAWVWISLFSSYILSFFFFFPPKRGICALHGYLQKEDFMWGYSKFLCEYILYTAVKHFRKQSVCFHAIQAQRWLNESRWTGWWKYVQLHFMNEKRENKSHHFRQTTLGKSSSKVPLGFQSATISYVNFSLLQT